MNFFKVKMFDFHLEFFIVGKIYRQVAPARYSPDYTATQCKGCDVFLKKSGFCKIKAVKIAYLPKLSADVQTASEKSKNSENVPHKTDENNESRRNFPERTSYKYSGKPAERHAHKG